MATTFTEADLLAIRVAIAKGEKTVQVADRSVTYRSMSELLEAEQVIKQALNPRPRQTLGYGSKGL